MGLWPDWLLLHLHINDDITFLLSQTVPVVDSDKGCFIHFKRHLLFQIAAFLDNLPVVDLQPSLFCHFLLILSCSLSCQWQLTDVKLTLSIHLVRVIVKLVIGWDLHKFGIHCTESRSTSGFYWLCEFFVMTTFILVFYVRWENVWNVCENFLWKDLEGEVVCCWWRVIKGFL